MNWNKERFICLIACIAALVLAVNAFLAIGAGAAGHPFTARAPQAFELPAGEEKIDWVQESLLEAGRDTKRDPFQRVSDWRVAQADPLPPPPLGGLQRRVPLPPNLLEAPGARPLREATPPATKSADDPAETPPEAEQQPDQTQAAGGGK